MNNFNRNALLGFIIFLLVLSNFFHHKNYSYIISNNGGKYLVSAQKLVNSEKAETVSYYHSRFIYPFLLALSFKIGEVSLDSAYLMTQFIFILTICALFWSASTIFGKWVAFFSCILIISTPTFLVLGRHIDINFLEALFVLSSYTIFNIGWLKKQNIYFWISGFFMALACFTRETSWIYIIYPIVYFILLPGSRYKIYLKNCLSFYASIIIVSSLSLYYLTVLGESYWELIGALQPGGFERVLTNSPKLIDIFQKILKGFSGLIFHGGEKFQLFPVMLISWGTILWSSIKRNSNKDRILLAMILPTLPILFLFGVSYTFITERHIILFFLLSYVSILRSLQLILRSNKLNIDLKNLFLNKTNYLKNYNNIFRKLLFIIIPISVIGIIQFSQIQNNFLLKIKKIRTGMTLIPGGRFSQDIKVISKWINNNIPENSILCVGGYFDHAITFYTHLNYEYRNYGNAPIKTRLIDLINKKSLPLNSEIVKIRTNRKFRSSAFQFRQLIYATTKNDIDNYLKSLSKDNQWIIYYKSGMNDLNKYHNQIIEIASEKVFENHFAIIYKTNSELKNYDKYNLDSPWVGKSKEDLYWLKKSYPKEYNIYIKFLQKYGVKDI